MKRQLQEMLDNADDESIRRAIQRLHGHDRGLKGCTLWLTRMRSSAG